VEETFLPWLEQRTCQIIADARETQAAVDSAVRAANVKLKADAVASQSVLVRRFQEFSGKSIWLQAQLFGREQERMFRDFAGAADTREETNRLKRRHTRDEIEAILARDAKVLIAQSVCRRFLTSKHVRDHARRMKKRKFGNNGAWYRFLLNALPASAGMTLAAVPDLESKKNGQHKLVVKSLRALGAAAHCGLMEDDHIVAIDGMRLTALSEFKRLIEDCLPGDEIALEVKRFDSPNSPSVKIVMELFAESNKFSQEQIRGLRDLEMLSVSTQKLYTKEKALLELSSIPRYLGMSVVEENKELKIRAVAPDGPAARAGVLDGDILYCLGEMKRIRTLGQFKKILMGWEVGTICKCVISSPHLGDSAPHSALDDLEIEEDKEHTEHKETKKPKGGEKKTGGRPESAAQHEEIKVVHVRRRCAIDVLSELHSRYKIDMLRRMCGLSIREKNITPMPNSTDLPLTDMQRATAVYPFLGVSLGFEALPVYPQKKEDQLKRERAEQEKQRAHDEKEGRETKHRPKISVWDESKPILRGIRVGKRARFGPATQASFVEVCYSLLYFDKKNSFF
jgi:hypothetical protein